MHFRPISLLLALTIAATAGYGAASSPKSARGTPDTAPKQTILVFPAEAIKSAMTMNAKAFHETYEGIDVSTTGLTDEGFYVRYEHENLVYYFGPIANVSEGVKWRDEMDLLRVRLVEKRPELESSIVYLIKIDPSFDYSTSTGAKPLGATKP